MYQYAVPEDLLDINHAILADSQHLRDRYSLGAEVAGKAYECLVLIIVCSYDTHTCSGIGSKAAITSVARRTRHGKHLGWRASVI